ncbi:hypothetical protein GCM10010478_50890 [Streptomyces erythrogriseus]|uniref:Uncharacterized protein n=1 Tax=Streptomyces erythrogriseus TaxID=284027 RepID=A0ABP6JR24_9ACTN
MAARRPAPRGTAPHRYAGPPTARPPGVLTPCRYLPYAVRALPHAVRVDALRGLHGPPPPVRLPPGGSFCLHGGPLHAPGGPRIAFALNLLQRKQEVSLH